jgi:hypothetical protein
MQQMREGLELAEAVMKKMELVVFSIMLWWLGELSSGEYILYEVACWPIV